MSFEMELRPRPDSLTVPASVTIWTGNKDGSDLREALKSALIEYGLDLDPEGPPVRGSWKQRFKLVWKMIAGADVVREPQWHDQVARRLQIELVERKAAEVDNLKAEIIAKLAPVLEHHSDVVMMVGGIVIVKHKEKLIVKTVDPATAWRIERSSEALSDPAVMLAMLASTDKDERLAESYPGVRHVFQEQLEAPGDEASPDTLA